MTEEQTLHQDTPHLNAVTFSDPQLPLDWLDAPIREYIQTVAEAYGCPMEYVAVCCFITAGIAAGKKVCLETNPYTFAPTRQADNLVAPSHLLCIDIDKKDNLDVPWFDNLDREWHNVSQILYAAHSVGGEGWFAIFRIAYPDKHREQFEALRRDFAHEGLKIDRSCSDVSRMRIISYDPKPYVNAHATIYIIRCGWSPSRKSPRHSDTTTATIILRR